MKPYQTRPFSWYPNFNPHLSEFRPRNPTSISPLFSIMCLTLVHLLSISGCPCFLSSRLIVSLKSPIKSQGILYCISNYCSSFHIIYLIFIWGLSHTTVNNHAAYPQCLSSILAHWASEQIALTSQFFDLYRTQVSPWKPQTSARKNPPKPILCTLPKP